VIATRMLPLQSLLGLGDVLANLVGNLFCRTWLEGVRPKDSGPAMPRRFAMKLRELLDQVKDLPPDTLVCTAEVDEAYAANIARIETMENARIESRKPDGTEAVELANGNQKVVVIRW
jgi:hypothetical protein